MPETPPLPDFSPAVELVPGGRVVGSIRPPGSKSLTNRALLCAAFASSPSVLSGALRSEDTEVMTAALQAIGVGIESPDGGRTLRIDGISRRAVPHHREPLSLFIANSGTTIRFLTAALSAVGGHYRLHGTERMHQRPLGDLIRAIAPVLDGEITSESPAECPPVRIDAQGWRGSRLQVAGSVSSQYLSGLLMAAPLSGRRCEIAVTGQPVSQPYVEMTAGVMRAFGAQVHRSAPPAAERLVYEVAAEPYRGTDYAVEPDASAASYFWAAAAITGGQVTVEGLSRDAAQGDVGFCDVLERMGCGVESTGDSITVSGGPLRGIDVDMNAISDTVQTLAVVALFAEGPTRVRGVAHNRFKETDRIGDLARELRRLGATVDEHDDGLTIVPPEPTPEGTPALHGATIRTYRDHRMAMSFALAGLRQAGVKILDPACTAKTYPDFFADLEHLTGRPHRWASH